MIAFGVFLLILIAAAFSTVMFLTLRDLIRGYIEEKAQERAVWLARNMVRVKVNTRLMIIDERNENR